MIRNSNTSDSQQNSYGLVIAQFLLSLVLLALPLTAWSQLSEEEAARHYDNMPPPRTPNAQTASYLKLLASTKGRNSDYSVPVIIWEPDCHKPRCQIMSRITQDTEFYEPPGRQLDADKLEANKIYEIVSVGFHNKSSGLVTSVFMMPQDYESYTGPDQENEPSK